jgi:large subunit ribosomal protein L31
MKADIHPRYEETHVTCSCGNSFTTRSTSESIRAELCNECHPFFTGKQKLMDTAGRIDRFNKRYAKTEAKAAEAKAAETASPTPAAKAAAE